MRRSARSPRRSSAPTRSSCARTAASGARSTARCATRAASSRSSRRSRSSRNSAPRAQRSTRSGSGSSTSASCRASATRRDEQSRSSPRSPRSPMPRTSSTTRPPTSRPRTASGELAADDGCRPRRLPADAVALLTVHQAKGLEWEAVFVCDLVEGRFPALARSQHALFDRDDFTDAPLSETERARRALEEERRLFYVALTRARTRLMLSATEESREESGRSLSRFYQEVSPFLDEVAGADRVSVGRRWPPCAAQAAAPPAGTSFPERRTTGRCSPTAASTPRRPAWSPGRAGRTSDTGPTSLRH